MSENFIIGGNTVRLVQNPYNPDDKRVFITSPYGKTREMPMDDFQKQVIKNKDKIENGEQVDFNKKSNAGKVLGWGALLTSVVLAVVYRKKLGKLFTKEFWTRSNLTEELPQQIKTTATNKWQKLKNFFTGNADEAGNVPETTIENVHIKIKEFFVNYWNKFFHKN